MNVKKKLLPIILAAGLMAQSIPTVWAEDIQQPSGTEIIYDDAQEGTEEIVIDGPDNGYSEIVENEMNFLSLAPLNNEYDDVYIERAQLEDQPEFTFSVSEILYKTLLHDGKLNENGEFAGKIAAKVTSGDSYRIVEWNDLVTLNMYEMDSSAYGNTYYSSVGFILSDDQLNTNVTSYHMGVYYLPPEKAFINNVKFSLYNNQGDSVSSYSSYVLQTTDNENNQYTRYSFYVSSNAVAEDDNVNMLISLPSGSES